MAVHCVAEEGGWACTVTVGDDPPATSHRVRVSTADLGRYAPPATTPERLVEASFAFLLEREPRESILGEFDLQVISRYFPEYDGGIGARLGRGG
jgi:hypothetical protein